MKRFYRQKIVLCISAQHVLLGVWQGKKLQQSLRFAQNQADQQALNHFLRQHPLANYSIILDIADEDYQLSLLPHSSGRAQKALLARKLEQAYRGVLFKTARFLSREQVTPKKDLYLFAAVRSSHAFDACLETLQSLQYKIAGVYLLPMLSEQLLHTGLITQHKVEPILLCEQLNSGLRQTFFANGQLNTSRLLSSLPNTETSWQDFYQTETEKYRLYLISQRLITADTALQVLSLNHEAGNHYLSRLANQLKLPLPILREMPELMQMQLLVNAARGVNASNLAPQTYTHAYRQQRLKHQFSILSAGVLAACTMLSTFHLLQGLQLSDASHALTAQVAQAQQSLHQLKQQSHTLTPEAGALKNIVDSTYDIAALPTSPHNMMQVLSEALSSATAENADIKLHSLDWSGGGTHSQAQPVQESALLSLEIRSESSKATFVANLRQHPKVLSAAILPTTEINASHPLQGSTTQDEGTASSAQPCKLNITLKPESRKQ